MQRRFALRTGTATQQDVEPRCELEEVERLGHIVVAASAQTADPLVHGGECAQDQYRCLDPSRPQRREHTKPVEPARQHAVENDRVVGIGGGFQQSLASGRGTIDREAVVAQRGADLARCRRIVLYHENSSHVVHRPLMGAYLIGVPDTAR